MVPDAPSPARPRLPAVFASRTRTTVSRQAGRGAAPDVAARVAARSLIPVLPRYGIQMEGAAHIRRKRAPIAARRGSSYAGARTERSASLQTLLSSVFQFKLSARSRRFAVALVRLFRFKSRKSIGPAPLLVGFKLGRFLAAFFLEVPTFRRVRPRQKAPRTAPLEPRLKLASVYGRDVAARFFRLAGVLSILLALLGAPEIEGAIVARIIASPAFRAL